MAASQVAPVQAAGAKHTVNWHRRQVAASVLLAVVFLGWLIVYGHDYYGLNRVERLASPKHTQLRPSGSIGYRLGLTGAALFVGIFLYPIRKRWKWLGRFGKTRNWLDFHIVMGLAAPLVITFHSSFKLQGIAGVAYWIMMSVVVSGIVGRYFYGQIPRRLDAAEMSLQEMQVANEELAAKLKEQRLLAAEDIAPLLEMPTAEEVQWLPLPRALLLMAALDLKRPLLVWRLRRKVGAALRGSTELREVIAVVRRQAALSKRILFLSKAQQVFHLWHVVHRPFSYSFALLSLLHVGIVLLLGYY
jgi:hypothetical protein